MSERFFYEKSSIRDFKTNVMYEEIVAMSYDEFAVWLGELKAEILKQWDVIYSPPMESTGKYDADYLSKSIGSKWIDMNLLSINPNLVVVDQHQTGLIKLLEKHGLDVIPLELRHSKMLGGGFHCVTLDIRRAGTLQRYFD